MKNQILNELRDIFLEVKGNSIDTLSLYENWSEVVGALRHESPEEKMDADRIVYGTCNGKNYGATTVELALCEIKHGSKLLDDFTCKSREKIKKDLELRRYSRNKNGVIDRYKRVRKFKVFKNTSDFFKNHKNPIIVGTMAAILVSGVFGLSMVDSNNFKDATKIYESYDLPNEIFGDYDLVRQNNGIYLLKNSEDMLVYSYNGITADEAVTYAK
ncbi:MAG: hypothetical protein IJ093_02885 [Bacilli bacterium]|nr:hypothetical protein [Bacilli bacterium]